MAKIYLKKVEWDSVNIKICMSKNNEACYFKDKIISCGSGTKYDCSTEPYTVYIQVPAPEPPK